MSSFNILQRTTLLQPRLFLEASAGTGKTFTIEHLAIRLLLETDFQLEQILIVTFTRAATRELKMRIRSSVEKIKNGDVEFDYLQDLTEAQRAKIVDALATFDQAQIFTIHGFCLRLLQEFALEAGVGLQLTPWEEKEKMWEALEFLRSSACLTPQQQRRLLGSFRGDAEKLIQAVATSSEEEAPKSAQALLAEVNSKLSPFALSEAFTELRPHYKGMTAQEFEEQTALLDQALQRGILNDADWDYLIGEKKLWLEGVEPSQLKVRSSYGGHPHVAALADLLIPSLKIARHPRLIFKLLAHEWHQKRKNLGSLYEKISPDDILQKVHEKLPAFTTKIQNKYKAVIVDEFQDTDPLQWSIFETLFLKDPTKAVYLVGDPKQSIYAFRKADIYTFMSASHLFSHEQKGALSTNFRSASGLIDILNRLFCEKPWLYLPRHGQTLSVPAATAAREGGGDFSFLLLPQEASPEMEEKFLFPFIVHQIGALLLPPKEVAVLVKDRYQAARVEQYLQKWNIPTYLLRKKGLGESLALELLEEFAEAFTSTAALKKVLLGPFIRMPLHEMTEERVFHAKAIFADLHTRWQEEGMISCIAQFLNTTFWKEPTPLPFYDDVVEIVGKIAHLVHPSQMASALRLLRQEEKKDRTSANPDGVQIMTVHASKGLEFDTVFALGVAWSSDSEEEELEAEKLRQFYVALTRAKNRLYVPFPESKEGSPLGVFWEKASPDIASFPATDLSTFSFQLKSYEQPLLPPSVFTPRPPFKPLFLQSFSSLAKTSFNTAVSDTTIPSSAETGTIIHRILEQLWEPNLPSIIAKAISSTHLEGYEGPILDLVEKLKTLPLKGFSLSDIAPEKTFSEMEFLFPQGDAFFKGFIDLCFEHKGVYFLIDWKTNALQDYTHTSLEEAMRQHDYFLQGKIYATAFTRYLKLFGSPPFGGIFFVFVRGPAVYHFNPEVS
jgi:exodeoxyribonuclease V beta subunit